MVLEPYLETYCNAYKDYFCFADEEIESPHRVSRTLSL
jgi:hypothetical protein